MLKGIISICLGATCIFADTIDTITKEESPDTVSYASITTKKYTNYLGVAAGVTGGLGISYRKWVNDKWGFQINFLPWYEETQYPDNNDDYYISRCRDSGYSNDGFGSLGIIVLRSIVESRYIRLTAFTGANLFSEYSKYNYRYREARWDADYITPVYDYSYESGRTWKNKVTLGVGFGPEFYVWRFSFHAMLGLQGSYEFSDSSKNIGPGIDCGVHFRF